MYRSVLLKYPFLECVEFDSADCMLLCSVLLFTLPLLCACQTLQKFSSFLRGAVRTPPPPPTTPQTLFATESVRERERRLATPPQRGGGRGGEEGERRGPNYFPCRDGERRIPPFPSAVFALCCQLLLLPACPRECKRGGKRGVTF